MSPSRSPTSPLDENLRIFRVASLTLTNAMLFQEILAQQHHVPSVKTIRQTLDERDPVGGFIQEWKRISDVIDFAPIFRVSREILLRLPSNAETLTSLQLLGRVALDISTRRGALRHDLMGRIFHRLLADPKYFGAFYTKLPAATLLLKLAIEECSWPVEWSDPGSVGVLKVSDLACGTGTLLKAALTSAVDRHIWEAAASGIMPDTQTVHRMLLEDGLWGFDVIQSAVHLAAATVAMHDPRVSVRTMHFYALPLGDDSRHHKWLGSIQFALGRRLQVQTTLMGASVGPRRATGAEGRTTGVELPLLDLVTMNPPFTRSVYGNLLFGNLPEEARPDLQAELRRLVRERHLEASITAGLGSVFVAIGDRVLKDHGVMALVLPKTVLEGSSWEPTRRIFERYDLRFVIVSHEPDNWYFSESSNISEVLLILQRRSAKPEASPTRYVNLWRLPKNNIESLSLARVIRKSAPASLSSPSGTCELGTDGSKFGEMIAVDLRQDVNLPWSLPTSFAQTDLCRVAYHLRVGKVFAPGRGVVGSIRMVRLGDGFELGPDGRDIYDGFDISSGNTPYPALWGYDAATMNRLKLAPNKHLVPLTAPRPRRPMRGANLLWSRAGRLMLPKEIWLDTSALAATWVSSPALSNVWWPTRSRDIRRREADRLESRLALWSNSTLGFFSLLMRRQETRGPWIKFPKTWYEELPVPDLGILDSDAARSLDSLWDEVADQTLLPFSQIERDPVRAQVDDAISAALGIPEFGDLRRVLAREPVISGVLGD